MPLLWLRVAMIFYAVGLVHAFFSLVNMLDRGNEAVAQVGGDIRAAVARPAAPAS